MTRLPIVCVVAPLALASGRAELSQEAPVGGSWRATWDQAIRARGAEVLEVQKRGTATLTIVQRGDSAFAIWRFPVAGGESRDSLAGTFRRDTLRLTGVPRTVTEGGVTMRLALSITGVLVQERLTGVLFMQIDDRAPAARRWEATRAAR